MPSGDGIGLDYDKTARPGWPRLTESHPEGSIDVLERHTRTIFLQRRHLLPQSEVFQQKVGSASANCPDSASTDGDDEDENF